MNWKQKLSKKLKKSGGFTLIEMLIVVAIIAILIAVSIPLVSGALDKARVATDAANERAAKAAAVIEFMTNGNDGTFYYDAAEGKLVGTTDSTSLKYGQCSKHKDQCIQVYIDNKGDVQIKWNSDTDYENASLDSSNLINGTTSAEGKS